MSTRVIRHGDNDSLNAFGHRDHPLIVELFAATFEDSLQTAGQRACNATRTSSNDLDAELDPHQPGNFVDKLSQRTLIARTEFQMSLTDG